MDSDTEQNRITEKNRLYWNIPHILIKPSTDEWRNLKKSRPKAEAILLDTRKIKVTRLEYGKNS